MEIRSASWWRVRLEGGVAWEGAAAGGIRWGPWVPGGGGCDGFAGGKSEPPSGRGSAAKVESEGLVGGNVGMGRRAARGPAAQRADGTRTSPGLRSVANSAGASLFFDGGREPRTGPREETTGETFGELPTVSASSWGTLRHTAQVTEAFVDLPGGVGKRGGAGRQDFSDSRRRFAA